MITKLKINNPIDSAFIKLSESLSNDKAQLPRTLHVKFNKKYLISISFFYNANKGIDSAMPNEDIIDILNSFL